MSTCCWSSHSCRRHVLSVSRSTKGAVAQREARFAFTGLDRQGAAPIYAAPMCTAATARTRPTRPVALPSGSSFAHGASDLVGWSGRHVAPGKTRASEQTRSLKLHGTAHQERVDSQLAWQSRRGSRRTRSALERQKARTEAVENARGQHGNGRRVQIRVSGQCRVDCEGTMKAWGWRRGAREPRNRDRALCTF